MTQLIPFDYQSKQVRTVVINEEPWFIAKDVCEIPGKAQNGWLGYVYAIEHGDYVKIGHTTNLSRRFKQIASHASNYTDRCVGRIVFSVPHTNHKENENILHNYFKGKRLKRSELFSLTFPEFLNDAPRLVFRDESEDKRQKSEAFIHSMKSFTLGAE